VTKIVDLPPEEEVDSRPFTAPANTLRDAGVMQGMLEALRSLAASWDASEGNEFLFREADGNGFRHWIRVPNRPALLHADRLTVVGFFGWPRNGVDHEPVHELEAGIVDTLETLPGVLSYYDQALAQGGYGNLILCETADTRASVHCNELHRRAVALTPDHYHSVRLHTGFVPGPFVGDAPLVIERTRYYDFEACRAGEPSARSSIRRLPTALGT
jgi:hypothetical protein